jgi:hypothetical protein
MFIPITSAKWKLKFGHQLNDKTAFCYYSKYRWDDWSLSIRIGGMNDLAVPLFTRFFQLRNDGYQADRQKNCRLRKAA